MPFESIKMQLLDGPFDELFGEWRFESLGDSAAKVYLDLEFSFKSRIADITMSPLFNMFISKCPLSEVKIVEEKKETQSVYSVK